MTDNYLGEIRLFALDYAPQGWHLCDGSLLNIQQYTALYSLIGITYGGNGTTNFALPDLRGRTPLNGGQKSPTTAYYKLGQRKGTEGVAISLQEMPRHKHDMLADDSTGNKPGLPGNIPAIPTKAPVIVSRYNPSGTTIAPLHAATVATDGAGQAHNNMQPFLTVNFCIALTGLYPPRPY